MPTTSRNTTPWKVLEVIAVIAVLALNVAGVKPFASGTLLFVFPIGWLSMRLRGVSWKSVGFSLPDSWLRDALIGIVGGVAVQMFISLVIDPLIKRAGIAAPKVEGVSNLASSGWAGLAATLLLVWFVGGFLEELCFRGYLMTRIADALRGRGGATAAVVLSTLYFGMSHWYQGPSGAIEASVTGLCFGLAYASTRNLFLPIVLHAALDTAGVVMLAAGFTGW